MVDGVFGHDATGLRFYPAAALDAADVDEVLATVEAYLHRCLTPEELLERVATLTPSNAPGVAGACSALR